MRQLALVCAACSCSAKKNKLRWLQMMLFPMPFTSATWTAEWRLRGPAHSGSPIHSPWGVPPQGPVVYY